MLHVRRNTFGTRALLARARSALACACALAREGMLRCRRARSELRSVLDKARGEARRCAFCSCAI
eukprot:6682300-Alexandrium_andersonii.AAC.1